MGIQGLLPLLKPAHEWRDMHEFRGQTIAVDAYVWLHKGAFGCAEDLVLGRPTTKFVDYCMHKVRLMQHHGVTPYVVFDGGPLPAKAGTEGEREQKRTLAKERALALKQEGRHKDAFAAFAQAVDVSPAMALQFIKALRAESVAHVVAPYEADAQLAFLALNGLVDGVLTEDSDLLVFGVRRVLFKMDAEGRVCCVERERLGLAAAGAGAGGAGAVPKGGARTGEWRLDGWGDSQFRHMAILAGCDYLPSIPGVGLKTAHALLRRFHTVPRVLQHLRLEGFAVPAGYEAGFRRAEMTFCHQRVWDPALGKVRFLTDVPDGWGGEGDDAFVGPDIDPAVAREIASGDRCPVSKLPIVDPWADFKPVALRRPAGAGAAVGGAQRKISDMFKPAPKPARPPPPSSSASTSSLKRSVSAPQPSSGRPPLAARPALHQYAFAPPGAAAAGPSSSGRARLSELGVAGPSGLSATARPKLRAEDEDGSSGRVVHESQVLEEPGPVWTGASRFFGNGRAGSKARARPVGKAASDEPRSDVADDGGGGGGGALAGLTAEEDVLSSAVTDAPHALAIASDDDDNVSLTAFAPLSAGLRSPNQALDDDIVSSPPARSISARRPGRRSSSSAGWDVSSDNGYISSSPAPAAGALAAPYDAAAEAPSSPCSERTVRAELDLGPICHTATISSPSAPGGTLRRPSPSPVARAARPLAPLGQLQFAPRAPPPLTATADLTTGVLSDSSNIRSDELDDDDDEHGGAGPARAREERMATIAAGWKEKFSLRKGGQQSLPGLAMASTTTTPLGRQRTAPPAAVSAPRAFGPTTTTLGGPSRARIPIAALARPQPPPPRSAVRPPVFSPGRTGDAVGGKENDGEALLRRPLPKAMPPSPSRSAAKPRLKRPSEGALASAAVNDDGGAAPRPAKRASLGGEGEAGGLPARVVRATPSSEGEAGAGGDGAPLSSGSRSRLERLRFRPAA